MHYWTDCGNRAGIDSTSDVMLVEAQLPPSLLALSCIHSHAPLPASISPRNAHCKLQTIAHSLSVHMCVSPCACVRVCVFPCRMPIVCARMDFCRWTEWIAATVQASIDDMASWPTSRHSCRHLSLHCLCAASMLHGMLNSCTEFTG